MLCDPKPEGMDQGSLKERKRGQSPSEWKRTVAKRKRNSGEMYVSRDTGKMVKQREVGPPCNDGCYARLGDDVVKDIHESFWKIGDYNLQNTFIQKYAVVNEVKRRRVVASAERPLKRSCTRSYSFVHRSVTYSVCALAFRNILGISSKRVQVALNAVTATGTPRGDRRGKNIPVRSGEKCGHCLLIHNAIS